MTHIVRGCLCHPLNAGTVSNTWKCPHGIHWFLFGEGQNAWTTVSKHQYYEILEGTKDPRLILMSKAG